MGNPIPLDYGEHKMSILVSGTEYANEDTLASVEITYGCTDGTAPSFGATYSPHCEIEINANSIEHGQALAQAFRPGKTFIVKCDTLSSPLFGEESELKQIGKFKIQESPVFTEDYSFRFSGDGILGTTMAKKNMDFDDVSGFKLDYDDAVSLVESQFGVTIEYEFSNPTQPSYSPLPKVYLPSHYKKTKKAKQKVLSKIKAREFVAGLALLVGANAVELGNGVIRFVNFGYEYHSAYIQNNVNGEDSGDYFAGDDYQSGYTYATCSYAPKSLLFTSFEPKDYKQTDTQGNEFEGVIIVKDSKIETPSLFHPPSDFADVMYDTEIESVWLGATIYKYFVDQHTGSSGDVSGYSFRYTPSDISFSGWNPEYFVPGKFFRVQSVSKNTETQEFANKYFLQFVMEMRFRWEKTISVQISSAYNGTELKVTSNISGGDVSTIEQGNDSGATSSDDVYEEPEPTPTTGLTYTVRLDLTDGNPATWGEWIDDAVGMTELTDGSSMNEVDEFMDYFPCTLDSNGNIVDMVDPDNYQQTLDGNALEHPECVMIRYAAPRGFKISVHDADYIDVSITSELGKEGYIYTTYRGSLEEEFFIGSYFYKSGGHTSQAGYSISNSSDTAGYKMNVVRDVLHAKGDGFDAIDNVHMIYLQCCTLVKYKGNPRYYLGGTNVSSTGTYYNVGLNYVGQPPNGTCAKQFGLECPLVYTSLEGFIVGFIEGTSVSYDGNTYTVYKNNIPTEVAMAQYTGGIIPIDIYALFADGYYNDQGAGYASVPHDGATGYVAKPDTFTPLLGFIPSSDNSIYNASASTFFRRYSYGWEQHQARFQDGLPFIFATSLTEGNRRLNYKLQYNTDHYEYVPDASRETRAMFHRI